MQAFSPDQLLGVQEEVQLREQDFGNFQGGCGNHLLWVFWQFGIKAQLREQGFCCCGPGLRDS